MSARFRNSSKNNCPTRATRETTIKKKRRKATSIYNAIKKKKSFQSSFPALSNTSQRRVHFHFLSISRPSEGVKKDLGNCSRFAGYAIWGAVEVRACDIPGIPDSAPAEFKRSLGTADNTQVEKLSFFLEQLRTRSPTSLCLKGPSKRRGKLENDGDDTGPGRTVHVAPELIYICCFDRLTDRRALRRV